MTVIININGPINAGKTTIAKILQKKFKYSVFVEVDDLLSDAEAAELKLSLQEGWAERLRRLDLKIGELKKQNYAYIIFAYPMNEKNYQRWRQYADLNTAFLNITLAPSLEVCLQNRGARELTSWEKKRIEQMYRENYHASLHADLIIDNSRQTPEETAQEIITFLKEKIADENI